MSHFTVMLKISKTRLSAADFSVEQAVKEMLAPYQENNMGNCPRQYLEFHDVEDEWRREYETESNEMIRCEDGSLAYSWDDQFRVPGSIGIGGGSHKVPEHLERVNVQHRERYATFEEYAKDWHGDEGRDDKTGRYGYWENPNKKWDWYAIGGRWSGFFPLKPDREAAVGELSWTRRGQRDPGHGDIVQVGDIDMDAVATKTRESAEEFWQKWQLFLETGSGGDPFDGPRSRALDIGLMRVEREPYTAREGERAWRWGDTHNLTDDRKNWHDVAKLIDEATFMRDYIDCFCPIKAYAALDDEGWHAPGQMGWFGCSSDTADTYVPFAREFVKRFIKSAAPTDTLVIVDCHI
jgi:hypothetical protein